MPTPQPFMPRKASWVRLILLMALVCSSALAQETMRPEVAKVLKAAQDALVTGPVSQALVQAREALAMPQLSAFERASVLRIVAVASMKAQDWDTAISSLEELLRLPDLSVADKRPLRESLIAAAHQQKDHARLVEQARAYLQEGGSHPGIRLALMQTLSVTRQHEELVREMQERLRLDAAAGIRTPEQELRLLASSYRELKNSEAYRDTLWRLLSAYHGKAYWAEYLYRLLDMPGFNPRLELDLYRLLEQSGNLEKESDYMDMVQLALKAGLPAEAERVLARGQQAGVLGKDASAHERLREQVRKKLREDDAQFAQLEKSAKDGNALAAVGDVLASRQSWAAASQAYMRALQAGGLRREAEVRLHHGVALLRAGQLDAARQQLQAVQGDATAQALARLWLVVSNQPL